MERATVGPRRCAAIMSREKDAAEPGDSDYDSVTTTMLFKKTDANASLGRKVLGTVGRRAGEA